MLVTLLANWKCFVMIDFMKKLHSVPPSAKDAKSCFFTNFNAPLCKLEIHDFISKWYALVYLAPGLHPDGYECEDSGWPDNLKPYAAEAWRRHDIGELSTDQLYCGHASWAGIYDQLNLHTQEEQMFRAMISRGDR
jgi:hypothetical protein